MTEKTTGGNAIGFRNKQTKTRNEHRRQFRLENPEHRGKQLKKLPLEDHYSKTEISNDYKSL